MMQDFFDFIQASPTPWHAVQQCEQRLLAAGFRPLDEKQRWQLKAGDKIYVSRGGASIIALIVGQQAISERGFHLLGAHTDSPGLRLKPKATDTVQGMVRVGVEVYGGPILATFSDRDLSLAGRIFYQDSSHINSRLIDFQRPLLRLTNLAIHMNRDVNENGLKFQRQNELPLLSGIADSSINSEQQFRQQLATQAEIKEANLLSWELLAYDSQPPNTWGQNNEFIASRQLDNLASCYAGLAALLAQQQPTTTAACAFFDHEEVGSDSYTGAGGSFLRDVLERVMETMNLDLQDRQRALANSFFISADMAHAWHPNYPAAYEPGHHVLVNAGPVIKHNSNQRYSSNAASAAQIMQYAQQANVSLQQYVHRSDLGCGSTIGPTIAAQLGINSIDIGCPMWAMHSARESAGVADLSAMIKLLSVFFAAH